jgi:hypothetical protein
MQVAMSLHALSHRQAWADIRQLELGSFLELRIWIDPQSTKSHNPYKQYTIALGQVSTCLPSPFTLLPTRLDKLPTPPSSKSPSPTASPAAARPSSPAPHLQVTAWSVARPGAGAGRFPGLFPVTTLRSLSVG